LRLASYRREWGQRGGVDVMRLSDGEQRTAQTLVNKLLAVNTDGRLYSTRKGEVQIELENDRVARQVRRARKR
jgi:hypothetical protein